VQPGQVIDRYTVETRLGQGGMASAWRVRHNTLGTTHALKLLSVADADVGRRMVAEGKMQATLRHPNIVPVADVIFVDRRPALLMELVEGPALEDWLLDRVPTLDQALELFEGILAGVARAHEAGLVHRDLKPGNVLLVPAPGGAIPKVTDFGLAKILEPEQSGAGMTASGEMMGTPQFMAPEQIRSARDVDARADIFALGCILYTLVTGTRPFDGREVMSIYNAIVVGNYVPALERVPSLPRRVGKVIDTCLQVDRERRFPTCHALAAALELDARTGGKPVDLAGARLRTASRATIAPPPRGPAAPRSASPPAASLSEQVASRAERILPFAAVAALVFAAAGLAAAVAGWFLFLRQP
jgi:serine/threonine-protein kinase